MRLWLWLVAVCLALAGCGQGRAPSPPAAASPVNAEVQPTPPLRLTAPSLPSAKLDTIDLSALGAEQLRDLWSELHHKGDYASAAVA